MNENVNPLKMPKQEDVTIINFGTHTVQVVNKTDENLDYLKRVAVSMYANEPCRICGKLLTMDDLHDGAVFAGYSTDNKSRSAHNACWENRPPENEWAHM